MVAIVLAGTALVISVVAFVVTMIQPNCSEIQTASVEPPQREVTNPYILQLHTVCPQALFSPDMMVENVTVSDECRTLLSTYTGVITGNITKGAIEYMRANAPIAYGREPSYPGRPNPDEPNYVTP